MPVDPRMVMSGSKPNAAPASAAALNNVYIALVDLSRRIDGLESNRTVIDPASLDGTQLKPDSITTAHIQAGAIKVGELEAGTILVSLLTAGAVNASHIDAASIRASVLDAAVLTAGNAFITSLRASILDAGILTATNATIGTLRASILNATQIVADGLQVQVLNAVKAAVTDLSSVASNTGTLTASLIQTAASPNARVELGTTAGGIKGYNSSNVLTFGFDLTTGAATVGSISVTGAGGTQVPASTLTGFVGGGNLMLNSSFESTDPAMPGTLWTNSGTTDSVVAAATAFHGGRLLRVNYASGTTPRVESDLVTKHAVPIGSLRSRPMVASVWVWVDTTATTLAVGGTDASLGVFDGTTLTTTPISTLTKGQWNRVSVKYTPAAGATAVSVRLYNPYTNGPVFYDAVQVEFGDAMTAYNPKADEIIYGSITTLELSAGAVKATNVEAGAITADKISLGQPSTVSIRNGQFSEGNPANGSLLGNGWTPAGGNTPTVQTDAAWGRVARIVNGSLTNSFTKQTAAISLPIGRHVFRAWCKTTTVAGAGGAALNVDAGTAVGTFTDSVALTGTNDWTLLEAVATVTTPGTVDVFIQLGLGGTATGTADFANVHVIPAITGTTLTPTAIDAMTITGAVFQTAAPGVARVAFDSTGFFVANAGGTKLVNMTSAGGLNIRAGTTSNPGANQRFQFLDSAGVLTGEMFSYSSGATSQATITGPSDSTTYTTSIVSVGVDKLGVGGPSAYLIATAAATASTVNVVAGVSGSVVSKTILDQAGASDFLQLTGTAKRKANFGVVTVTFPGGGDFSNFATITHSLGVVPASIVLTPVVARGSSTLAGIVDTATPPTTTQATVYLKSTAAGAIGAGSFSCYWMAAG